MNTHSKKSVHSRARKARPVLSNIVISQCVVLDQVGFVKHRSGRGVLRLKLVGPVDRLRRLRLVEGERLGVERHQLIGEHAA